MVGLVVIALVVFVWFSFDLLVVDLVCLLLIVLFWCDLECCIGLFITVNLFCVGLLVSLGLCCLFGLFFCCFGYCVCLIV